MAWQIVPPNGGWHFIARDGTRIDADSHDSLVKALASYRTDNALPLGDPEVEVDTYICTNWPNVCGQYRAKIVDEDEPPKVYGQRATRTTAERIASWAANRYSRLGSVDLVDSNEAERRATICLNCPKNDLKWREKVIANCPPCKERMDNLDATLYKIRGGKGVARSKGLGACLASGCDCATAVWLGEKQLQHAKHYLSDLDPGCWMIPIARSGAESSTS